RVATVFATVWSLSCKGYACDFIREALAHPIAALAGRIAERQRLRTERVPAVTAWQQPDPSARERFLWGDAAGISHRDSYAADDLDPPKGTVRSGTRRRRLRRTLGAKGGDQRFSCGTRNEAVQADGAPGSAP